MDLSTNQNKQRKDARPAVGLRCTMAALSHQTVADIGYCHQAPARSRRAPFASEPTIVARSGTPHSSFLSLSLTSLTL